MNQEDVIWRLERRDGTLVWGSCSLPDLAHSYGTPLYVINVELLKRSLDAIRRPFDAAGLDTRLFFSYKTNPVPTVLRRLAALGCGAEIISEFEYWLATRTGLGSRDIVVNGSWKAPELLRQAVMADVALINVECLDELRLLQATAARLGRPVSLGLRVNPCLWKSPFDFTLSSGTRSSHAGFRREEPAWTEAVRLVRTEPLLQLKGLHFHIGSGVRSPRPYIAALKTALDMWTDLLEMGLQPTLLDIGGGLAAPTLKAFSLLDAVRFFGWKRPPGLWQTPDTFDLPGEVAGACARILAAYAREHGVSMPAVYIEPGRALVAASQLLLLRVVALRSRPGGLPVAICDAGAMSLSPLLLSERHAILPANRADSGPTACYDLVGSLPAPLDIVALRQRLPALEPGDVIAVMDVGAYFTALGNTFAGPRPPIVLIEDGRPTLVRERESYSQVVGRDLELRTTAEDDIG